jgi:hypothetical protein
LSRRTSCKYNREIYLYLLHCWVNIYLFHCYVPFFLIT